MMRPVGFYYWRGRVFDLYVGADGQYRIYVPAELMPLWLKDKAKSLGSNSPQVESAKRRA
jgi:hypothetical protein